MKMHIEVRPVASGVSGSGGIARNAIPERASFVSLMFAAAGSTIRRSQPKFANYLVAHAHSSPPWLNLTVGIIALLAAAPTFAATWVWTGAAGNDHWTNTPNWNPVSAVPNNGTADVSFGPTARLTPDMNANWSVNSVNFLSGAPALTLGSSTSSTLTIGAGGITNNDTDNETITHAINLSAAQTWNANAGELDINGAINNGGNLLTLNTVVGDIILPGALSGSGGLVKTGRRYLVLQGVNSFTGATTVNSGTVWLGGTASTAGFAAIPGDLNIGDGVGTDIDKVVNLLSNRIADTATVNVFPTGAWELFGGVNVSETITNLNILSTGVSGAALITVNNTLAILGNVTMTGGTVAALDGSSTLSLKGNLTTNATDLVASINSNLDLNSRAHTFTIGDGTAQNDLDVTGVVSNGSITKADLGTLRLAGANTFAGGTTLNAGTLALGSDNALGTGALTIAGGAIQADGASRLIPNAVNLNVPITLTDSLDLTLSGPISGTGGVTKTGTGTLTLAGVNSFTGGISVTAGTLTQSGGALTGVVNNQASFVYNGGTFSGQLLNHGSATFNTTSFTAGNGVVNFTSLTAGNGFTFTFNGSGLENNGLVTVAAGGSVIATSVANQNEFLVNGSATAATFTNSGLLHGTGQVTAAVTNSGSGDVRIVATDHLRFAGASFTNQALIEAVGSVPNPAEVEFLSPIINTTANGLIAGSNSLYRFTGGLTNQANFALSIGTNNVFGDVTNSATGTIIVSGGAGATFYDDIVQNGTFRVSKVGSTSSVAVVLGAFSGSGGSTGGGDIFFEGDLRPGNSPAAVTYDNNVGIGAGARLEIELGGNTPGSQYDQVHVNGALTLSGTLAVSLINGYSPTAGASFDILDWSSLAGTFSALQLPALPGGLTWNTSRLYTTGVLSIGLSGDYNGNGTVDAADYVIWRDGLGVNYTQNDYNVWRSNFGHTAGSGASATLARGVIPEPSSVIELIICATFGIALRLRGAGQPKLEHPHELL